MIDESEIRLLSQHKRAVRNLAGFRKHHRLPERGSVISDEFLASIAKDDLHNDLDETFSKLKSEFGFKRRQLKAADPVENFGEILTPGFTYEVSVATIEGESRDVMWRRAISRIEDAESVSCPEFERTFGRQFNTLEFPMNRAISVEDVIDEVEDCEDEMVKVDYEKDASWCRIEFRGKRESIFVESDRIRVSSTGDVSPSELIDTLLSAHARFFDF